MKAQKWPVFVLNLGDLRRCHPRGIRSHRVFPPAWRSTPARSGAKSGSPPRPGWSRSRTSSASSSGRVVRRAPRPTRSRTTPPAAPCLVRQDPVFSGSQLWRQFRSSPPHSCVQRGWPPAEGAADHHQTAMHAGEQAGAHRCPGEASGGPNAGPQVPQDPDWEPDQQQVHAGFRTSHLRRSMSVCSCFSFLGTQGCSFPTHDIIFCCFGAAPKPSKAQHSESKSRKREQVSCSSSDGSQSGSEASDSSEVSAASSEHRRKKHHKEKKRSKKAKDYSRKRGSSHSVGSVFISHIGFRGTCRWGLLPLTASHLWACGRTMFLVKVERTAAASMLALLVC